MNFPTIPSWASVALKAAPYVAILILVGLLTLSNGKVDSLKAQLAAKSTMFDEAIKSRDSYYAAVRSRDLLIDRQNASIQSLADKAAADRTAYLKQVEAARTVSADHRKAAATLLSLTAPDGELAQCRAARDLLEGELVGQ